LLENDFSGIIKCNAFSVVPSIINENVRMRSSIKGKASNTSFDMVDHFQKCVMDLLVVLRRHEGAMTLSIMTFSIMTLSITFK
jgi:hypothetical protein